MQSNQNRTRLGDDVRVARKCACTQQRVFYGRPGHVLGAADRDLNDSIGVGTLESSQRDVQRFGGGDVDEAWPLQVETSLVFTLTFGGTA